MLGENISALETQGVISLSQYLAEQSPEKPYKLLILSHDDPLDPNETAPMIKKVAEKLGITVFLAELMGCYMEDDGDNKLIYSYQLLNFPHLR